MEEQTYINKKRKCGHLLEFSEPYGGFNRIYFKCKKWNKWIGLSKCIGCEDSTI